MIRINISHSPTSVTVFKDEVNVATFTGKIESIIENLVKFCYHLGLNEKQPKPKVQPELEPEEQDMIDEGSPAGV